MTVAFFLGGTVTSLSTDEVEVSLHKTIKACQPIVTFVRYNTSVDMKCLQTWSSMQRFLKRFFWTVLWLWPHPAAYKCSGMHGLLGECGVVTAEPLVNKGQFCVRL